MSNLNTSNTAEARFADTMNETQASFDKKLANNREKGWEAITSGEWNPFSGFPFERFNNLEIASIVLSEESQQDLDDRVVAPLMELFEKHGIEGIFTGVQDQEPHVTLDVFEIDNKDPAKKQEILDKLHSPGSKLKMLGDAMVNSEFALDSIVVQPPNIYICSSKADESQIYPRRFRDIVQQIWQEAGDENMEHRTFTDIFHVTVARFVDKEKSIEEMTAFGEEVYETVGKQLEETPLKVTTDVARFVNGAEDLQREVLNREAEGIDFPVNMLEGAPLEWIREQKSSLKKTMNLTRVDPA